MAPQSDSLPLVSYALMVWRRRFLVLVVALGMALPAFAVSKSQIPQYQAAGQILLTQRQVDENVNVKDSVLTDTQVANQIAILTGAEVADHARQQGGTSRFRAVGGTASNVVTLSADDPDPQRAAATVEAYMRAFSEFRTQQVRKTLDSAAAQMQSRLASLQQQIDRLQQQIDLVTPADRTSLQTQQASVQTQQAALQAQLGRVQIQQALVSSGVQVVQNPAVGQSPVSPTPVRDALLALVLGLALGISLAVLLETLRRRSAAELAVPHTDPLAGPLAPARHDTRSVAPVDRGRTPTPGPVADDPT
jgi:succinoglycan biosynthesis transport protein ExoP